jgi:hypothetical protein
MVSLPPRPDPSSSLSTYTKLRTPSFDSDNGSEFINDCLWKYCKDLKIQFTRGRPYKKDDNAHIEQKNWTHVRKLLGWERFDSQKATDAINELYGREWRLMMNLFQPSVKLLRKLRVGSRLTRKYDMPQTPLDRLLASGQGNAETLKNLKKLRETLNPFELACSIDRKLEKISRLASPARGLADDESKKTPKPQSLCASRLPRRNSFCLPAAIRAAASVILRVTNSVPRLGDSWLKRMPETAKIP